MRSQRIAISAVLLVLLLGGMAFLNSLSERPKPPPDVPLEGRLSQDVPEAANAVSQSDAAKPAADAKPSGPLKVAAAAGDEKPLVEKAKGSLVKLETAKGNVYLDLYDDKTPVTVGSFLELVNKGFYDGLTFHRVIADFMAQGGDPKGDGSGGPGFTIPDEADKGLKHVRGALSMAKTSAPNTGGSQFFICYAPQTHLDGVHTVFGECVKGMDAVDKITVGDKIVKATILKKSKVADDDVAKALKARVPE
jgi:cyclophilin family peptidyl-prolyl cis-trans isomerase